MMFQATLFALKNGHLLSWDKQLFSSTPLPDTVIDPYSTKKVPNVEKSMDLTFSAS
ncbi:MAG: hypothetical protein IJI41_00860 [Anaerolineaceae bacterium]|nr:hypothetical protein [Anaerolineaceae bacterium]